MSEFVLYAPLTSKALDKPIAFAGYSGLGPMTSADPSEWRRWPTADDAKRSPAYAHPLAIFDVRAVEDVLTTVQ